MHLPEFLKQVFAKIVPQCFRVSLPRCCCAHGTKRSLIPDSLMEGGAESNASRESSSRSFSPRETETRTKGKAESMKKLFLTALAIVGLTLVPTQRSHAQSATTVLVPRTEGLSFGFPSGYYASPSYLNFYPYGYYRHPYVHYYPYAGNPYAYYSAPPTHRYTGHRTYRHRHHSHHSE